MENLVKLGLNPAWLVAQIVNFILLLLILRAVAYKPILNMLDARSRESGPDHNPRTRYP